MGKDDFLTAKAIGKRIKAKGLQKLRWFCQMCEKQCRDENGFKCHINSEAHQRQMLLFNENANKMLTGFSAQFKQGFLDILSSRYGTRRVLANSVYQDYIANRYHVHMNATCWSTLTQFCKYLGREGECKVEETERGWYLTWIDRRPETLKREKIDLNRSNRNKGGVKDDAMLEREWMQHLPTASSSSSLKVPAPPPTLSTHNVPAPLSTSSINDPLKESSTLSTSTSSMSTTTTTTTSTPLSTPTTTLFTFTKKPSSSPLTTFSTTKPKKKSLAQLMAGSSSSSSSPISSSTSSSSTSTSTTQSLSSTPTHAPLSALEWIMEKEKQEKLKKQQVLQKHPVASSSSSSSSSSSISFSNHKNLKRSMDFKADTHEAYQKGTLSSPPHTSFSIKKSRTE